MNLAIILAAGTSERITGHTLPKQFIEINQHPLIIHCLKTFLSITTIEKIVVVVHQQWEKHLQTLLLAPQLDAKRIDIVIGGNCRNQSLLCAIKHLQDKYALSADDVILTHDAARAFVTQAIILNNIHICQLHNACNTAIKSIDTIFMAQDETWITQIPNRNLMYCSQTPQTFKWSILQEVYLQRQHDQTLFGSVDTSTLVLNAGYPIKIVAGNQSNFKVTTDEDLLTLKNRFK